MSFQVNFRKRRHFPTFPSALVGDDPERILPQPGPGIRMTAGSRPFQLVTVYMMDRKSGEKLSLVEVLMSRLFLTLLYPALL